MEIEIKQSVKSGIREFIKSKEPHVMNILACTVIFGLIAMNYQINSNYHDSNEGTVYDNNINKKLVALFGFIFG
jgi:hypothetical protein